MAASITRWTSMWTSPQPYSYLLEPVYDWPPTVPAPASHSLCSPWLRPRCVQLHTCTALVPGQLTAPASSGPAKTSVVVVVVVAKRCTAGE